LEIVRCKPATPVASQPRDRKYLPRAAAKILGMNQTAPTAHSNGSSATHNSNLRELVRRVVDETPVFDIHTHLAAPAFDKLFLFGIDDLLTYHYLVAEFFRFSDLSHEEFWKLSKTEQADRIWQTLFVQNTPLSEACRGVLTTLQVLGLDPNARDLSDYRKYFAAKQPDDYTDQVMQAANVSRIGMTNSPFDDSERPVWESGFTGDPRFMAALRIDPLLMQWDQAGKFLQSQGYQVSEDLSGNSLSEVQRFLRDWAAKMKASFVMVSLPPDFAFPEESPRAKLIEGAVLPFCRESGLAFALMPGVVRNVNPLLKMAGDGVEVSDLSPYKYLCANYSDVKFLMTILSRENQHEACVLARKFGNLHLFGCWWFLNTPGFIEEMTRMRLELLGPSFTAQHSDARVLEQIIYKWSHSRAVIAQVLAEKYELLAATGFNVSEDVVRRDAKALLGGAFESFIS
jgi:hypothetical protein